MRRLAVFSLPPAAVLLCLSACTTVHEAAGDKALDEGRATDAIAAYTRALSDTPILDYDFERIRDKRKRIIEGEWGPKLDALEATQPTTAPVEYATRLIEFRRGARNAATTQAFARRIDAVLTAAVEGDRLVVTDPTGSARHVSTLLDLFAFARKNAVPLAVTDGIAAALAKTASVPWPAAPNEGLQRLELLLRYKATARAQQLPASVDGALDARLTALDGASFAPATREEIDARFALSLKLRADARSLGAPPVAVSLADRVHDDALALLLTVLDEEVAAHRPLAAVERAAPFVAQVESAHPLRARLTRLQQEGAAWHRTHAKALPPGYRQAMHHALAFSLGGDEADRKAQQARLEALGSDWKTSLALDPRFNLGVGCGGQDKVVAKTLTGGARPVVARFTLGRCQASTTMRRHGRSASYVTEEKYTVTERVQVGYRYEQVRTGSRKVQCTKASSLEGYVWQGLCEEPTYENKRIDVYEDRLVEKVRDVSGSVHYTVDARRLVATVAGSASLEWEDGTTLTVPVEVSLPVEEEAWDYTLPPRRLHERGTRYSQGFTPSLTEASLLAQAAATFARQASNDLHAAVRAHRARLARAEAVAAADEGQRAEAFIRSVLLDSRTEAEAAAWFASSHHLEASVASALVLNPQARAVPAASPELVVSGPWDPPPLPALSDGFERATGRLERELDEVTAITYGDGILPPNEYVAIHMGLAPLDIHAGTGLTTRPAISLALDLAYGLLEYFSPRYGLVFHDEAGIDLGIGLRLGGVDRVVYDDGKEGGSAFRFEASYALFGGLRTPWFGVFAGANAGYAYAFSGDTVARGGHLEPAVRLGLRFWRTTQLLVEASGFTPLVPGVAHRDRLAVSFPLSGRHGMDLRLSWERTTLPTRALASDGETDVEVAPQALQVVGVQFGMRL